MVDIRPADQLATEWAAGRKRALTGLDQSYRRDTAKFPRDSSKRTEVDTAGRESAVLGAMLAMPPAARGSVGRPDALRRPQNPSPLRAPTRGGDDIAPPNARALGASRSASQPRLVTLAPRMGVRVRASRTHGHADAHGCVCPRPPHAGRPGCGHMTRRRMCRSCRRMPIGGGAGKHAAPRLSSRTPPTQPTPHMSSLAAKLLSRMPR